MLNRFSILLLFISLIYCSCSTPPTTPIVDDIDMGGASETVNAFVVTNGLKVTATIESDTLCFPSLYIVPACYSHTDSTTGSVDSLHRWQPESFSLQVKTPGTYNIFIADSYGNKGIVFKNVSIDISLQNHFQDTLVPNASVQGKVLVPDYENNLIPAAYTNVAIAGTPYYTQSNQLGDYSITNIVASNYRIQFEYSANDKNKTPTRGTRVATQDITVAPGEQKTDIVIYFSR